jgi:methylenetetrahydrofolate dehydrogenase (NADP+) / methenyltetrahydrofolate cyclohydrolase
MLFDGRLVSGDIKLQLAEEVDMMVRNGSRPPHLSAILVGHDGASETYVASKVKNCAEAGFQSSLFRYESDVTEKEILNKIEEINNNPLIDGLIVQLPLPPHINVQKVTESISPAKDVDGFHPVNIGRMVQNLPCHIPATPYGILLMLEYYNVNTAGKHCVIVGRSNIVGMPMSILMARNASPGNCTVTLCHSKTTDLASVTRTADILIAALGKPGFITADMIREKAIVIDVGITRVTSSETKSGYKITGDVDFKSVEPKASWITPVPGGVGLMTIIGLLKNTLRAAKGEINYN